MSVEPLINVRLASPNEAEQWDRYVLANSCANLYDLCGWKNVIEKTYGHKTYYLIAQESSRFAAQNSLNVLGILPLVHMKHFLFGNKLISLPFFDMGGILADNEDVEKALLNEAVKLGQKLGAKTIELRHTQPLSWLDCDNSHEAIQSSKFNIQNWVFQIQLHKVRMLLQLPGSSDALMKSFKSKLRSQIRKPVKEGLVPRIGGTELLDDFYKVFTINMRNLGSPVHTKNIMRYTLEEFEEKARIIIIYKDKKPLACSLVVGFRDTLENPWASSLREYSRLAPNMLLYWTMLEYACQNGYKYFDFGRSTPGEGTYRFKEQWGAKGFPLYWYHISIRGKATSSLTSGKSGFSKLSYIWRRLPLSVTRLFGPLVRKHISL